MSRRKKIGVKTRPTFAIVVDGETEVWYFQMLKRNERSLNVNIEPKIPQRKTISEQYHTVMSLSEDYTKVFWIVDFDTIIKETREAKKGIETPYQKFIKYRRELNTTDIVEVIINNPCIEYWFLIHFVKTAKPFRDCGEAEKELIKYMPSYEKTQKYFTKQNDDIYLKLKPHFKKAIDNVASLTKFNFQNPIPTLSEMDLFFRADEFGEHFIPSEKK